MKNLKWAILALIPLFLVGVAIIGCQKEEATTTNLLQNEEAQAVRSASDLNGVATEEEIDAMPVACGTPSSVNVFWSTTVEGYCRVRFTCASVPTAQLYNWEIHLVYNGVVDPVPYVVKNTTGTTWNYGVWGDPDCFQIWVRAKCPSGFGQFKKSSTKCPSSNCIYP